MELIHKYKMLRVYWLQSLLILPLAAQSIPSQSGSALVHVNVIDLKSGHALPDQTVVVQAERIIAVGAFGTIEIPPRARAIDASGKYVMPGLWDAHVHLSYLGACALPIFVANGVTSVRDAGARMEDIATWQREIAKGTLVGPRIKAAGPNLESGELLERARKVLPATDVAWQLGPRREISGEEQASAVVQSVAKLGVDFIKFRNLPRTSFLAVMAAAKSLNLPVAGHAPKGTSLTEASEAGMKSIEHAESVMLALGSLSDDEGLRSFEVLARNGTLITPTLITDVAGHLTPDKEAWAIIKDRRNVHDPRRKYISARPLQLWRHGLELKKQYDEGVTDWSPEYKREAQDMRLAHRAGVRLMAGTDVGGIVGLYPGFSVHDELELLVKEVGLTPSEALRSAILNPPAFFDGADESGTIEPGKRADLVMLDANPLEDIRYTRRIRAVVLGGRFFQRANLDELLASAASAVKRQTGCAAEEKYLVPSAIARPLANDRSIGERLK